MKNYITVLVELGCRIEEELLGQIEQIAPQVFIENRWFSRESVELSLSSWVLALKEDHVRKWLHNHQPTDLPKNIGIVAAGNIPLVGLHDLLCVLVSGHHISYKKSQNDQILIGLIYNILIDIEPELKSRIHFVDKIKDIDAVIATGSNNTSRYFEYYFSKVPHIIRKNRTSVAIIKGDESEEDIIELSKDIFSYFGLGCRNVSKLYLPQGYDILKLLPIFEKNNKVRDNTKYMNNYDYNRAILMLNLQHYYDTGNLILIESPNLYSSVSTIHYEFYSDIADVENYLMENNEKIQCIITNINIGQNKVSLGQTQYPMLWDYADDANVLQFLSNVNNG